MSELCRSEAHGLTRNANVFQRNGPPAAAEVPVPVPPLHLLHLHDQWPHREPAAALHTASVADR